MKKKIVNFLVLFYFLAFPHSIQSWMCQFCIWISCFIVLLYMYLNYFIALCNKRTKRPFLYANWTIMLQYVNHAFWVIKASFYPLFFETDWPKFSEIGNKNCLWFQVNKILTIISTRKISIYKMIFEQVLI